MFRCHHVGDGMEEREREREISLFFQAREKHFENCLGSTYGGFIMFSQLIPIPAIAFVSFSKAKDRSD